jgi:glucuronate isomerase
VHARRSRDMGADIPTRTDYVHALKPLLDRFGNETSLTIILFTSMKRPTRELAPLAGHYPALRLRPARWFYDSPEGMRRHASTTRSASTTTPACSRRSRHRMPRRLRLSRPTS